MPREGQVTRTIRFPDDVDRELQEMARSERSTVNREVVVAVERAIRAWKARQQRAQGARGADDDR
jgi:predicted transcriptional regulator